MAKKKYTQYSKKLATAITVFWCGYRVLAVAALLIKPELGETMNNLMQGVDDIMMCNILAYNGNSLGEKGFINYFNAKYKNKNGNDVDNLEEECSNG